MKIKNRFSLRDWRLLIVALCIIALGGSIAYQNINNQNNISNAATRAVTLTNLIGNGTFETNNTGWVSGSGSNAAARLNPAPSPQHTEYNSVSVGQINQQINFSSGGSQNKVAFNYSVPVVAGHVYYMRALYNAITNVETAMFTTTGGSTGTAPTSTLGHIFGPTGKNVWNFIDHRWTATSTTNLAFSIQFNNLGVSGNTTALAYADNVMVIDLTAAFGAGNEIGTAGIRNIVDNWDGGPSNNGGHGYWSGSIVLNINDPPVIDSVDNLFGLTGRSFSGQVILQQDTGTAPFNYSILGLPAGNGLSIDSNGLITGTLGLTQGQYPFTVQLIDGLGFEVSKSFTLNVGQPPVIVDTSMPNPAQGIPYSFTPTVTGSNGNLTFTMEVASGTLPDGLTIVDNLDGTMTLSGTPTTDGETCQIRITATNDYDTVSAVFRITVTSKPLILNSSPINQIYNQPFSVQFTASGLTPITWSHESGTLPAGVTFNPSTAQLTGTPTQTGTFSFAIRAVNALGEDNQIFVINVNQLPVITTTGALPYAANGFAYSQQLAATGTTPIAFSLYSGSLPPGLQLNSNGTITGTSNTTGNYTFQVQASNIAGLSNIVTLTIQTGIGLAITTGSPLRVGTINQPYGNLVFEANGVLITQTQTWSVVGGVGTGIPPGMTFNAASATLSGTPTAAGTYTFNIRLVNGSGAGRTAESSYVLVVGAPPVITYYNQIYGGVDRPFAGNLQASGSGPITWNVVSGPTPAAPGLQISSNGSIQWLIPDAGDYDFIVTASNQFGTSAPFSIRLTITTPAITDTEMPFGVVGESYNFMFNASGAGPFTWSVIGSLPPGLSLDPDTGVVSGTPTTSNEAGYTFQIRATGAAGYAQEEFVVPVYNKPRITTLALNSGNVSAPYTQNLAASGSTPMSWDILLPGSGETGLPAGLSLVGSQITGTPSSQGTYTFTVRVQNATGLTYADTRQFTITIGPSGAPIITTVAALSATFNTPYSLALTANGNTPITYALDGGSSLPPGLSLNSSTGVISGTPTNAAGGVPYTFTIIASNSVGSDSREFTMTVARINGTAQTVILAGWFVGSPNNPSVSGNPSPEQTTPTYQYQLDQAGSWTLDKPLTVGTHNVIATWPASTNFNAFTTPIVPFTISPAPVTKVYEYIITANASSGFDAVGLYNDNSDYAIGTAGDTIQNLIDAIRADAAGNDCVITFDNLDLGSGMDDVLSFADGGDNWGTITLNGALDGTSWAITVSDSIDVINYADLALPMAFNSTGTLEIIGGTLTNSSGDTVISATTGNIIISGGIVDGIIDMGSGTLILDLTPTINGTISVESGNLSVAGTFAPVSQTYTVNITNAADGAVAVVDGTTFRSNFNLANSGFTLYDDGADLILHMSLTISTVSPPSGPTNGGTEITVRGLNFIWLEDTTPPALPYTVTLDIEGTPADCENVNIIDNNTITCTTTAHEGGLVSVTVDNSVETYTLAEGFLYADDLFIEINASSDSVELQISPTTPFDQSSLIVGVATNNPNGYTLSMLSNGANLVCSENPALTIPSTVGNTVDSGTWGFQVGTSTTTNGWMPVPTASSTIASSNGPTFTPPEPPSAENTRVNFAVRDGKPTPINPSCSQYVQYIIYTAVANI